MALTLRFATWKPEILMFSVAGRSKHPIQVIQNCVT